jgi:fatty acid desaturase
VLAQSTLLLWLWVLPMLIGYGFLRPYLLSEHTGCAQTSALLENTRTTHTNAWVRWFAWNMPFHTEHHAYPGVPFHALPALHVMMADHLMHTSQGYIAAWRAVRRFLLSGSN